MPSLSKRKSNLLWPQLMSTVTRVGTATSVKSRYLQKLDQRSLLKEITRYRKALTSRR